MNIGLDMMGGDFAPLEAAKGVSQFLSEKKTPPDLTLVGDEQKVKELLQQQNISPEHVTVVHADQVIDMDESPTKALKEKQRSSISIDFHLLASGKTDEFISAGNYGAMMIGSVFSIKALDGFL